jgi:hypothetical protein
LRHARALPIVAAFCYLKVHAPWILSAPASPSAKPIETIEPIVHSLGPSHVCDVTAHRFSRWA